MKYSLEEPICKLGVWDTKIPGIKFDENGVSNYAKVQKKLMRDNPRGERGKQQWEEHVKNMKRKGNSQDYDCIMGVSGGTDSSYLLHIAKKYGLRVLAVNVDNGFNSDIAVRNIKKVTSELNFDFTTYVINYEEIKDIFKTYMKASLPWIDNPSDRAIKATLFNIANKNGVKYILSGTDFRSEGMQPNEWTYSDVKQLKYLQKKYGTKKFDSYPYMNMFQLVYYSRIKGIKRVKPFDYLNYEKKGAQEFLKEEYDWNYYGGHHHENAFTKFAMSYWLPRKFGIDKRKISLSAQILSGEITRDQAIEILQEPPIPEDEAEELKSYILKKLDISLKEFEDMWNAPNKFYYDYPNNFNLLVNYKGIVETLFSNTFTSRPKSFYQIEMRENK